MKNNCTMEISPDKNKFHSLTWKIPVYWGMMGFVYITSPTLGEAVRIASETEDYPYYNQENVFIRLNDDDTEFIRMYYNNGIKDLAI